MPRYPSRPYIHILGCIDIHSTCCIPHGCTTISVDVHAYPYTYRLAWACACVHVSPYHYSSAPRMPCSAAHMISRPCRQTSRHTYTVRLKICTMRNRRHVLAFSLTLDHPPLPVGSFGPPDLSAACGSGAGCRTHGLCCYVVAYALAQSGGARHSP